MIGLEKLATLVRMTSDARNCVGADTWADLMEFTTQAVAKFVQEQKDASRTVEDER